MPSALKNVVIGLFGQSLDRSMKKNRWKRWRPSLSILMHEDLIIDRFDLLVQANRTPIHQPLIEDMHRVSPETEIREHDIDFEDPWDFENVFNQLLAFCNNYPFDTDRENYLIHITTGTHVAQICLFLLTEAGYFPGKLLQSSPRRSDANLAGSLQIIDLDLSKYDSIASRFAKEQEDARNFLKSGIATRNAQFNQLIERIEVVAIRSQAPVLLMGPTGAGKSQLAKRIFELKKNRRQLRGKLVEVNCATLHGDAAMSTLFGHVRGAFTGASQDRPGLLREAHEGMVFLDEIGELGADEQAMLLRALEERRFLPVGADREAMSDFQLIAGTNRDLQADVAEGRFREDLLARINLWTFTLPGLCDRREDIEPNLQFELEQYAQQAGHAVGFNKEAYHAYLGFAEGPKGLWRANFRDLNASITRMATLATGHRIKENDVWEEILRLEKQWHREPRENPSLNRYLTADEIAGIDLFDRFQLAEVLRVCEDSRNLAEAGRQLFQASRQRKSSRNDSDRLRKYLTKFGIDLNRLFGATTQPR